MVTFIYPLRQPKADEIKISKATAAEEELVDGLRAGNKDAIETLYTMYSAALMGIITRIVKYDEIAEDVLQDTFLKIWKSIEQYDTTKGRLFTWIANLAKNTAIDQVRSKYYANFKATDDLDLVPPNILERRNQSQLNLDTIGVKQLMAHLKPDEKRIIDLFYFEGYTHVEVSVKLNMPLGTVKTKIRKAILVLRHYFNETHPQFGSLSA